MSKNLDSVGMGIMLTAGISMTLLLTYLLIAYLLGSIDVISAEYFIPRGYVTVLAIVIVFVNIIGFILLVIDDYKS